MMKRYEITSFYNVAGYGAAMNQTPKGEWVKFEDVEKILKEYQMVKNAINVVCETLNIEV